MTQPLPSPSAAVSAAAAGDPRASTGVEPPAPTEVEPQASTGAEPAVKPKGSERPLRRRISYVVRRLGPFARRHRRWLLSGMLGSLLVVACRLSFPWPLRGVLELAFGRAEGSTVVRLVPAIGDPMLWLAGSFVAIALCQGLAELVQRLSFARFSIGMVHDARSSAVEIISSPDYASRSTKDPGDVIARVIGDSARLKAGVKGVLYRMTQNGVFFVGVAVMLIVIEPRLGLAFVAGGVLIGAVAAFGAVRVSTISTRLRRKEGQLASRMHGVLTREDGAPPGESPSKYEVGERAEAKTTKLEGFVIWGVHGLLGLTACAVLVLGLGAVRSARLSPADLFTILFYLTMVHNPTVRLARQTVRMGRLLASAERLAKVLKRGEAAERPSEGAGERAAAPTPSRAPAAGA